MNPLRLRRFTKPLDPLLLDWDTDLESDGLSPNTRYGYTFDLACFQEFKGELRNH
ncbi:MAG TPA: hypothetical protein VJX67_07330 [Blastocatellia bacterium]|nr:hypothetical protein [Blastocatellia bacterium]